MFDTTHPDSRLKNQYISLFQVTSIFLIALVMLVISPLNPANPGRDSGVFLYVGQAILSGHIPYRDVWDHKPPLIYYIDTAGLMLTAGSLWGVPTIPLLWFCRSAVWISQTLFNPSRSVQKTLQEFDPDGSLLVWGAAQVELNFLSGRTAPTRFAYQYPLSNVKRGAKNGISHFPQWQQRSTSGLSGWE